MGMYRTYLRWRSDRSGATAIEYALIAGIMAVALVGATGMMTGTGGLYTKIKEAVEAALRS